MANNHRLLRPLPAADNTTAYIQRLKSAMYDALSEQDMAEIVRGLVERAKQGDQAAIKTLFDYVLGGKPNHQVVTHVDLVPVEVETPGTTDALPGSAKKLDVMAARARRGIPVCQRGDGPGDE